jgi:hypothetical protein
MQQHVERYVFRDTPLLRSYKRQTTCFVACHGIHVAFHRYSSEATIFAGFAPSLQNIFFILQSTAISVAIFEFSISVFCWCWKTGTTAKLGSSQLTELIVDKQTSLELLAWGEFKILARLDSIKLELARLDSIEFELARYAWYTT